MVNVFTVIDGEHKWMTVFVLFAQLLFPFMNIVLYILKKGAHYLLKKGQIRMLVHHELKRLLKYCHSKVTGKDLKKKEVEFETWRILCQRLVVTEKRYN